MTRVHAVHRRLFGIFSPLGRFAGSLAEPRWRVLRPDEMPDRLRRDIGLLDGRDRGDRAVAAGH